MELAIQATQPMTEATGLPVVLRLRPVVDVTDDQFFELCRINDELRIERTADGELLIMPPAGAGTGHRNLKISVRLGAWAERDGTGLAFDSSAGFTLPNGAVRSPDGAWISRVRWEQVPPERRDTFAPICPDFVLELRSPSDVLRDLHDKMAEYLANGARLGWLLDPRPRQVYVYRPGEPPVRLDDPASMSADPILKGFILKPREIW